MSGVIDLGTYYYYYDTYYYVFDLINYKGLYYLVYYYCSVLYLVEERYFFLSIFLYYNSLLDLNKNVLGTNFYFS